jgi:flagellar biosynthesis activator protein FlaF
MLNQTHAIQAYKAASRYRSQREQEAEVFRQVNATLLAAGATRSVRKTRALADNRRLWMTVSDLMRDESNQLPAPLRAAILSIGISVNREMDRENPDVEFLASINEQIAAGLCGSAAQAEAS